MSLVQSAATAVINVHREGALLTPTLRSLVRAKELAAAEGFQVRFDVIADRADSRTMDIVDQFSAHIDRVDEVDYANLTLSRDHGIRQASTDFVFLHDGDDLYSTNWYAALWRRMQTGGVDDATVYHTRLFARFGDLFDVFKTPDSESLSFDPHALLVDWFFSNKCAFHRGLIERCPIPPIDMARGLGNEDWSWSADSIADGVRHTFLPDTICFYRVKPSHLSLGAAKGVMQSPSPLYEADHIDRQKQIRQQAPLSHLLPNAATDLPALRAWPDEVLGDVFDAELAIQSEFEPLLTQFPRHGYTGSAPVSEKQQNPQLGRMYRRIRLALGDADLDVIWMPRHLPLPKDHLLDWTVEAMALDAPAQTPPPLLVMFEDFDDPDCLVDLDRWNGLGINLARMDASGIYGDYQKSRFLMRFVMQNQIRHSIDFGSPSLARMVRDFPAAYSHFAGRHSLVLPQRRMDWYDAAIAAGVSTACLVAQTRETRCPVLAFAAGTGAALDLPSLLVAVQDDDLMCEADTMAEARFSNVFGPVGRNAGFRTTGPMILADLMARTRAPHPCPAPAPQGPGLTLVPRGPVQDLLSAGAVVNRHFRDTGSALLERSGAAIALPCNIFFRLDDRDHAMWLPPEDPVDSVARFLDLIAAHPAADIPVALTLGPGDTAIAQDLARAASPLDLYTKLAVDYADRLVIAPQSVVLPGVSSW